MNTSEIKQLLAELEQKRDRTIVIVDWANVERWKESLGWEIDIQKLGKLVKHFASGKAFLRRFYYGADFGKSTKSLILTPWSSMVLNKAKMNGFEVVTKRVKYIVDRNYSTGYIKKCNLDIEMAMDLIREIANYDVAVIFSGDGDLACVMKYLHDRFGKRFIVIGARGFVGAELYEALSQKSIEKILYASDFEYRLDRNRP
ncbi:MAG TPA: NYN domain-containing protein [bacterium]|nr:NYN domain-containing protein [bacterium]